MNSTLKYSVQLITNEMQLTEALSLRYKIYSKVYPGTTEKLTQLYETDSYDKRSIHLGLYCEDGADKKLAGYCRLILPEYFKDLFPDLLITSHPYYLDDTKQPATQKLVMMELLPAEYKNTISCFCDGLESENKPYIETSRFIIDEAHRNLSLNAFFVSGMFAVSESLGIRYSFFTCTHHHVPFYSRYGLSLFPGIAPYANKIFGNDYVIFGTDLDIANAQQNAIKTFRMQLEAEQQITFKKAA